LLAQLAERTIRHPGHRGDENIVGKGIGANIHGNFTAIRYRTRKALFYPQNLLIP